jgi:hypothetical protein
VLELKITKRTDENLLARMETHYSQPKGFVGRSICYAVFYNSRYYGHIIAGSATRFLPGRNEFLGISLDTLNLAINNIFFNVSPVDNKYPIRNFTTEVVKLFVRTARIDWKIKYGDSCIGFETLIEKPRTGELYLKAGWRVVGETKGYTCKRTNGKGTDSWTGRRVWNTDPEQLKPKIVMCYKDVAQ